MKKALTHFTTYFDGDLFFDSLHKLLYATDASVYRKVPLAVAYPKTVKGIEQLISFATEHKTSLIPRTAGTSLAGQCVGEGIVVDVSRYFTKIISVDEANKTVTVQPGVIRDELNAYLAPYRLFFGPNTSTSNRCMIGGMVGNNSSGTTSIQYGVTRDKVLALRTLLSNGERVIFSEVSSEEFKEKTKLNSLEGRIYNRMYAELAPKEAREEILRQFPKPEIHRRNTGYAVDALLDSELFGHSSKKVNLSKLLCGSEGTLAFTTEITLQLDDLPPTLSAMVVAQYEALDLCLQDVTTVMRHHLHMCELMDDVILERTKENKKYEPYRFFVVGSPKAVLMLEVKAHHESDLEDQISALQQSLTESGRSYTHPVLRGEEIQMAVELRKAGLGLLGNMVGDRKAVACIEDTAVTLSDLPQFIGEFASLMQSYGQEAVYYAHAGAGELHLRPILNLKTHEGVDYFRKITTDVAKLTKKYRGSFSGEHGDGIVRAEFLEMQIGTKNFELLKRIKTTFDPWNIFNPGKITDAWPMDQSLRNAKGVPTPEIETLMDFKDSEGILRLAEKCNGSGDCRKTEQVSGTMCPSYHATRNEKDTTRGRANALREVLTNSDKTNKFDSEELKQVFDLCLSCKACSSECPSNVDIATVKAEFLFQYHTSHTPSRADRRFGYSSRFYRKATQFPRIINFLFTNPITAPLVKNAGGIARKRPLPKFSSKSFSRKLQSIINHVVSPISEVVLFVDEFSNFLEADIAEDAYYLLTGLGYNVTVVDHLDSARALISKGFLAEASAQATLNVNFLKDKVSSETPLLGIEPSAILGFRDEYPRLAEDSEAAGQIAKHTYLIEEFIASEVEKGHINSNQFNSEEKNIKIHVHCHQKSLSDQKVTFDILNLPKNFKPTIIPSGCCGMAGSFGYEKNHFDVSMQIGELKLFPVIRKTSESTLIAANGTSCRHQIHDGTKREALHPVTILRRALLPVNVSNG